MLKLNLVRAFQDWSVTLGMLQIEGENHPPIFTLENPLRTTPIDSLIPVGLYGCRPYTSPRFPEVYEITGVPRRSSILIHPGNFEKDTAGCVLVGFSAGILKDQVAVMQSRQAMEFLRETLGHFEFLLEIR
jgi:hypothetical protein